MPQDGERETKTKMKIRNLIALSVARRAASLVVIALFVIILNFEYCHKLLKCCRATICCINTLQLSQQCAHNIWLQALLKCFIEIWLLKAF